MTRMTLATATLCVAALVGCSHEVSDLPSDAEEQSDPSDPSDPTDPKKEDEPQPEPESHPCDETTWSGDVALGTGETCFEEVTEGESFTLIAGMQGGFHMWIAFRCADCQEVTATGYGVKDSETGEWMVGQSQQSMIELHDFGSYKEAAGIQAMMPGVPWEFEDAKPDYLNRDMTLWLQVQVDGETIERELRVHIDHVESWSPPCEDETGEGCLG